jgi:afadin
MAFESARFAQIAFPTNCFPCVARGAIISSSLFNLHSRYRASTHYRPDLTPTERAQRLSVLLEQVAAQIQQVVVDRPGEAESLTFWMANASELLHFLKADRHISAFTLDAQDILAETVHASFNNMISLVESELSASMPSFWLDSDDNENASAAVSQISLFSLMRSNHAGVFFYFFI